MSLKIPEFLNDTQNTANTSGQVFPGGITNDSTPMVYIQASSADLVAGNTISIYAIDASGHETLIGSKTLQSSSDLTPEAQGIPTTVALAPGQYEIIARSSHGSSAPEAIVITTTAPNAPVVVSATDKVLPDGPNSQAGSGVMETNDPAPTFRVSLSGTGAVAGDHVQLGNGFGPSVWGDYTLTPTDIANGFALMDVALPQGWDTAHARLEHADGSFTGWSSSAFTLREETVAPAAPQIQTAQDDFGTVTGFIPNGGTTDDTTPTLQFGWKGETFMVPPNTSPGHSPFPQSSLRRCSCSTATR